MYKPKHLPLLALALLVSSTELRAEDFPFKVGDKIRLELPTEIRATYKITKIKGKWFEAEVLNFGDTVMGYVWVNSDQLTQVVKIPQ